MKKTNTPSFINALHHGSFAAMTLTKRFPSIIQNIIDRNDINAAQKKELVALRQDILTGPISPLTLTSPEDLIYWKDFNEKYTGCSFYEIPFFKAEAYIYKRIMDIMEADGVRIDPFLSMKIENVNCNIEYITNLVEMQATYLPAFDPTYFDQLILRTLWANSADLSQLEINNQTTNSASIKNLVIDDRLKFMKFMACHNVLQTIDYVADNAGIELLTDLLLIDYLLSTGKVDQVILHLKQHPTFVSDATVTDVHHHLYLLSPFKNTHLQEFLKRIENLITNSKLVLQDDAFWNSPYHFTELPANAIKSISQHTLIIFKGDANYRRLFEDRQWPQTTLIKDVLNYIPIPALSIRTLKSEIILGISDDQATALTNADPDWLTNGLFGLVMFIPPSESAVLP